MNEIREIIIENLNGRVQGVNLLVATSGISGSEGFEELKRMQGEGLVHVSRFGPGSRPTGPEMFRLSGAFYAQPTSST